MVERSFIGRESELQALEGAQAKGIANLVIIQGRRRIGKSRLVEQFAKNYHFIHFVGLAPEPDVTAQMQREEFVRQLCEQLHLPKIRMDDWGDIFSFLVKQIPKKQVVILFDEISWMGSKDPTFLGKLKTAWDTQFKKSHKLMLVLCGSVSSWIEKNIIKSTLFLGRPTLYLSLKQLSLKDCSRFWQKQRQHVSAYEKLKMLSLTGGVPRYLELLNTSLSAEENIRSLCFTPNAPLLNEFEFIFSDIFGKRSKLYKKMIRRLLQGPATQEEILDFCDRSKTGDFSEYLTDLEMAGFICRDYSWNIKKNALSKLSRFRLQDNYMRFYLKYIEPNKPKIMKSLFAQQSLHALPGWQSILGLQFENLLVDNSLDILQALTISPADVLFIGPYFQRKTNAQAGCQIDLLIQTRFNCVYLCEIKFHQDVVKPGVTKAVEKKMDALIIPKGVTILPVLIHVNGVADSVVDSRFFAKIIDCSQLV